jgi:hypothetical protein
VGIERRSADCAIGNRLGQLRHPGHRFRHIRPAGHVGGLLAKPLLDESLAQGRQRPRPDQCVDCKVPLFVGGAASIDNLDITDLEVAVSLNGQLFEHVRNLRTGQKITKITLSKWASEGAGIAPRCRLLRFANTSCALRRSGLERRLAAPNGGRPRADTPCGCALGQ